MINCRCRHLSLIFRSNHSIISLLKNPKKALKKEKEAKKAPQKPRKRYNNNDLLSMFPKEFHRKTNINTKMSHQLYLANETIAEKIAKHLTDLPDQSITFVETNPGPGMLTDLLVKSGVKDLRLFERQEEFLMHLEETYASVYPDRVKLKHADLISLQRVLYTDCINSSSKADEILSDLPVTDWQHNINFRLFGATASTSFFKQLINSILFQNGILALGRCELYMVMPSIIYITLTSSNKTGYAHYRAISTLFQMFFEYELLDKFPRTDFLPHICNTPYANKMCKERSNIGIKAAKIDSELMYFVKIVPRRDLYQLIPPDQIQKLWHFIKLNFHSRHNAIIPFLEKLIPGCGSRLLLRFSTQTSVRPQPTNEISLCEIPPTTNPSMTLSHQDYYDKLNIFTEFGDLQPSELFTLFHEFRMLPEYFSCNFLPSLENVLLKMNAKPDDVDAHLVKPSHVHSSTDVEVEVQECDIVKEK